MLTFPSLSWPARALLGLAFLLPLWAAVPALAFESAASHVYAVEVETDTVLVDKGGSDRIATASMSKMMTAYVVFEQLKAGKLKLDDQLTVSEDAWRTGLKDRESKMFVPIGGKVSVEDLIRGMIIQSGNDACVVLAEGVSGSVEGFAKLMNDSAARLGLTGSHFTNPHGLPDPDHYSTAHDLAVLGRHLIVDFPEYYHYFSEIDFTYNNIKQGNRNPLLYETQGADGIKTGHTDELGFSLAGSVKRGDRRVVFVMTGLKSMRERSKESALLVEYLFRDFQTYAIARKGDELDQADVWLGTAPKVPLVAGGDLMLTLSRSARHDLKVTLDYDAPVKAPVAAGTEVGKIVVSLPDQPAETVPLLTGGAVPRLGALARIGSAIDYLIWRGKT